jgi:hypothetical protein
MREKNLFYALCHLFYEFLSLALAHVRRVLNDLENARDPTNATAVRDYNFGIARIF